MRLFLQVASSRFWTKMRCCSLRNFCASSPLSPVQLPSPIETHIWYVVPDEVNSRSLLSRYMEILSPIERENVLSMPGDQLRKRAILARTLVRTTIARYQIHDHVDPRSIRFRKNMHGKPEVDWQIDHGWSPPPLHFNISHTSSLIACGVAINSQIGIDVEEKQRKMKNNILAFARRYFTSHEVEFLRSIPDSEVQRQEFIKLWTLKEAYVKALGKGFSASPFKTFSIRFRTATNSSIALLLDSDNKASEIIVESSDDPLNPTDIWQFALVELAGSHFAAVCMEKDRTIDAVTKVPIKLTAWKTIPLIEDECTSGTDMVVPIGFLKQF